MNIQAHESTCRPSTDGNNSTGPRQTTPSLSKLQHQLHLRQADIEQRDFALLAMQTSLECTKSIVKKQQTELEWLMKQRDVANRVIAHLRTELDLIRREVVEAKHRDIIRNRVDQQAPASSAGDRSSSFVNSSESSKPLRSRTRGWKQIDEIKERNRELTQEICDLAETVSHLKRVIKDKADAEQRQSEVMNNSCMRYEDAERSMLRLVRRQQKETKLLTREKECLSVELQTSKRDIRTQENNIKELQSKLAQTHWELEDTQRQQKKRFLAQSQEHEQEITKLEGRMRKSARAQQQVLAGERALVAAAEARERKWWEQSMMASCEVSERVDCINELKAQLDKQLVYQLMLMELSKSTRAIESSLCCAACSQRES